MLNEVYEALGNLAHEWYRGKLISVWAMCREDTLTYLLPIAESRRPLWDKETYPREAAIDTDAVMRVINYCKRAIRSL